MDRTTFMEMLGGATVGTFSQIAFTDVGTFSWVVPQNCLSISAVTVQGGQAGGNGAFLGYGGDGGDLRYKNDIAVKPGEILTITVGAGGVSSFTSTIGGEGAHTTISRGSTILLASSTPIGNGVGGGNGGAGGWVSAFTGSQGQVGSAGAGGGAGGYSGNGGGGAGRNTPATSGAGGGGGGGGMTTGVIEEYGASAGRPATSGGGVGLSGQGANGVAGVTGATSTAGGKGSPESPGLVSPSVGGGGSSGFSVTVGGSNTVTVGNPGAHGGARLVWPGNLRKYPSTRTVDE